MIRKILHIAVLPALAILLSSPAASGYFGAKFEPADEKVYHCAQAEVRPASMSVYRVDWDGMEQYVQASGYRPKMIMHYITLDPFGFSLLRSSIAEIARQPHGYMAQIGLDFYRHPRNNGTFSRVDITADIAQGTYDATIRELAQLAGTMKVPIFLRPGFEFGGNGYGQYASKKYWIKAWKRIVDIFRNENIENVAFVWNTLDAADYIDYYPGDDYVDWWAINVFRNDADNDEFVSAFVKEAARHKKPVMIAESTPRYIGSGKGERSWNAWYGPYFKLLSQYAHIKAFCYINASWRDFHDKSFQHDARIQSHPYVFSNYRKELSDPRYIHSRESSNKER